MNIAFIGLRGIPAQYGGIESFVEEVAVRLSAKGHKVTVYSRHRYASSDERFKSISIIWVPSIKFRLLESFVHSFASVVHTLFNKYDIVHLHCFMAYFTLPLLKLFKKRVVITMHGPAWLNISYNRFSRIVVLMAAKLGMKFADCVTSVTKTNADTILRFSDTCIHFTPVGINMNQVSVPLEIKRRWCLDKNGYILFLGRLEKVKRVDWLINVYKNADCKFNLVIAGDTTDHSYKKFLKELAVDDNRIIFTGYVKDKLKSELLSNCKFFILPSYVEGLPVALLEAMSYSRVCLASDISAHRSIITDGKNGFLFKSDDFTDLVSKMNMILSMQPEQLQFIGNNAALFVRENFDWDNTVSKLERLYFEVAGV